jgi:phospholipid/cholesterol/gamma-HCH transport system substrate-binding protein
MKRFDVEVAVGIFVILGILALTYLSIKLGEVGILRTGAVPIYAEFSSAGGLQEGADVEIAGVTVGRVESITLSELYQARVRMAIREGIGIPADAIASVRTRGLIGEQFISISPGGSEEVIPPGGTIRDTEPAFNLESVIGELIHGRAR